MVAQRPAKSENYKAKLELESVSIAEPLQNRQHTQNRNAVNSREKVKDGGMYRQGRR